MEELLQLLMVLLVSLIQAEVAAGVIETVIKEAQAVQVL
jgi:hypothetical protein